MQTGAQLTLLNLKLAVLMLNDIFEDVVETFTLEFGIDRLYIYSVPLKAFIHFKELLLLLENNIRGGVSCLMGVRSVESDGNENLQCKLVSNTGSNNNVCSITTLSGSTG